MFHKKKKNTYYQKHLLMLETETFTFQSKNVYLYVCRGLRSWGHLRAGFQHPILWAKNMILAFWHLLICIFSDMNAKKIAFGIYVFVYLACSVFEVLGSRRVATNDVSHMVN